MKAYITAYALTMGIEEIEAKDCGDGTIIKIHKDRPNSMVYFHGEGREWHKTREDAVTRAEEMRSRKIASLEKQLTKLKAMKF